MGDVVQEVIYNEGVPYLTKETIAYIQSIANKYIPQIENWIVQASKYSNSLAFQNSEVFANKETGEAKEGIDWFGGKIKNTTLIQQFSSHTNNIQQSFTSSIQNSQNYNIERLLKEGYRILAEFGEKIRRDKIRYRLYVYDNGELGINDVTEYDLSLNKFLSQGVSANINEGVLRVSSAGSLEKARIRPLQKLSFDLDQLNLFIRELKGYFLFAGNYKKHMLASLGNDLEKSMKTINLGHVFETALNYPDVFIQYKNLTDDILGTLDWVQITEAEAYWESFDEKAKSASKNISLNIHKIARIFQTLKDPSDFWQGGEGDNLKNVQVKVGRAQVTNLSTLTRQMVRVRSIVRGVNYNVESNILEKIPDKNYEQRIVEGLLKMFDRRFTGTYSIMLSV